MRRWNVFLWAVALSASFVASTSVADSDGTRSVEAEGFGQTVREAEDDALRTARRQSPGLADSDILVENEELIRDSVDLYNNAIVESWERVGTVRRDRKTGLVKVRIRAVVRDERSGERLQTDTGKTEGAVSSVRFSGQNLYAQIASRNDVADEIGPVLSNSFETPVSKLFSASVAVKENGAPALSFDPASRTMSVGIEVGVEDREGFEKWADQLCDRLGRMCDERDDVRYSGDLSFKIDANGACGMLPHEPFNMRVKRFGHCFCVLVPRRETRWRFTALKNDFRLRRFYFNVDKAQEILTAMNRIGNGTIAVRVAAKDADGYVIEETENPLPGSFLFSRTGAAFRIEGNRKDWGGEAWRIMPGWTSSDGRTTAGSFRTEIVLGPFGGNDLDRIDRVDCEVVDGI